jgi:uncharacterized phage protein (TIGR01671 family)
MNRERKFRAWDKRKKEMIENKHFYFNTCNGYPMIIFIADDMLEPHGCGGEGDYYELMDYTGKKDRNEKEIFEADIIGFSFGIPPTYVKAVVYWNDYDLSWCVECIGDVKPKHEKLSFFLKEESCYEIEVIGDKYSNLEMLKE